MRLGIRLHRTTRHGLRLSEPVTVAHTVNSLQSCQDTSASTPRAVYKDMETAPGEWQIAPGEQEIQIVPRDGATGQELPKGSSIDKVRALP